MAFTRQYLREAIGVRLWQVPLVPAESCKLVALRHNCGAEPSFNKLNCICMKYEYIFQSYILTSHIIKALKALTS